MTVAMHDELVSVIIPAFNAGSTLDETLRSARAQTYPSLEILVVDDGSSDQTRQIAEHHAGADSRVRVFCKARAGPSAARNWGIQNSRGSLIAPLDADDLWRPDKIERQVHSMRMGGARVGLSYTWFALIDVHSRIISTGHRPTFSGEVLRECCRRNLIGNGSGALMRKSAILECGGYDERLEACEDLKLYTSIAERYHYALVPDHLTGYRQFNGNLTSDVGRIRRSADALILELEGRFPQFQHELGELRRDLYHWLLRRGVSAHRWGETWRLGWALWRLDGYAAVRSFAALPWDLMSQSNHTPHFLTVSDNAGDLRLPSAQ